MSADLALELEDVVFRYQEKGRRNILDHTSLTIPAGTLTVLMGGSGCGKSTLAAVAAGLYPDIRHTPFLTFFTTIFAISLT